MKVLSSLFVLASMLLALPASADTAFEAAFRTSLLKSFDEASGKIIQLAEAIPEDKYGWQPMTGVNTVREVLVHVTETNLALGGMLGAAPLLEDVPPDAVANFPIQGDQGAVHRSRDLLAGGED